MKAPLLLHLLFQVVLLFDALGWEVKIPREIHGLRGSCLVIPCFFSYSSDPPKNPRIIVWYQWYSWGYPVVYDPKNVNKVIEKFRGKTDLYGSSDRDCSLLIKKLEQSHHGERVYAWIDPEHVGRRTYTFYDVTSKIYVDERPQPPSISICGGERMGETITVNCSTFHTCPYSNPTITLNGIEGSDNINHEPVKDGQWKITLTRKGVIKTERMTIECFVTHYGGTTVKNTKYKTAKCVPQQIKIEPEPADVTEGVAKIFTCNVYHSCESETPTITWNYRNMSVSSTRSKKLSGLNQVTYSSITFLGTKEDHRKKLICTATFSGGNIVTSVDLHVQPSKDVGPTEVQLFDALGWEVKIPREIHGLRGSCLVIPCSFSYSLDPPKNPRRVVWYQRASRGCPLVYDPLNATKVIEKFRGKTYLYGSSDWDCSLLIKNLEQAHSKEKLYTRIDPEHVAWNKYKHDDVTSTILVDADPLPPSITVYGGEIVGEAIIVLCSTSHTCPYNRPTITLNGIEGSEQIDHELIKDGLWKITLTCKDVMKTENLTIECSATHDGGRTVTATKDITAQPHDEEDPLSIGPKTEVWPYILATFLVFFLSCIIAGFIIYKKQQGQPLDMQALLSEQRRSRWNVFSSQFKKFTGKAAWSKMENEGFVSG